LSLFDMWQNGCHSRGLGESSAYDDLCNAVSHRECEEAY
jgi:hypothetical protein